MESGLVLSLKKALYWETFSFDEERLHGLYSFSSEDLLKNIKEVQQRLTRIGIESDYFKKYNLYHDFILRYRFMNSLVFSCLSGGKEVSLTYPDLYKCCESLALEWKKRGVRSGQRIAVVLPISSELLVVLSAGLKLGLCLSFLAPCGKSVLEKRLKHLSPDWVCIGSISTLIGTDWENRVLPVNLSISDEILKGSEVVSRGYSYEAKEKVFEFLDEEKVWEIGSHEAYLMPLVNALVFFDLYPQRNFFYFGDSFHRIVPSIFLCCMSVGAGLVYVESEDINHLESLEFDNKHGCMIEVRAREKLLKRGFKFEEFSMWFKDPVEDDDLQTWSMFLKKIGLEEAYSGNVRWEPRVCGCSLISPKVKGMAHFYVLPPLGIKWDLRNLLGKGKSSKEGVGVFSFELLGSEKEFVADDIVSKYNGIWVVGGSFQRDILRKSYLSKDVCEFVKNFLKKDKGYQGIVEVVLISLKAGGFKSNRVLLIFMPEEELLEKVKDKVKKEILEKIEKVLGKEFLPDEVELFSLFPRYEEKGKININWCTTEYISGGLSQKEGDEVYRLITKLKAWVLKN